MNSVTFITYLSALLVILFAILCIQTPFPNFADDIPIQEKLTVRVNTFRRLDLLEIFLDHYSKCSIVEQIQVVWSDQVNAAPVDWLSSYSNVIFEIHKKDSLNNRFIPLEAIKTNAILSVDDDLVIPCEDLTQAMRVWLSNRQAMVGFSPRMTAFDVNSGKARYLRWQHTWWNGFYSLMLTKVSIFHKDYLAEYSKMVPTDVLAHVEKHRNCEDIAMAHIIAQKSEVPPVWVAGTVYEIGTTGISSGGSHFVDRGVCLDMLRTGTGHWPWLVSLQKAVPIGWGMGDWLGLTDFLQLAYDPK